jgi:hypothetical protein
VDPPVLSEFAFNETTRKLIRITAVNSAEGTKFIKLMSDDPSVRKELLGV